MNICENTLNIKDQTYVSIVLQISPQLKLCMKFYVVVNYYLVTLSFKFYEDSRYLPQIVGKGISKAISDSTGCATYAVCCAACVGTNFGKTIFMGFDIIEISLVSPTFCMCWIPLFYSQWRNLIKVCSLSKL